MARPKSPFIGLLMLAQMWNLLAGYAGLVSIGQQAYVGLGGYALVVLADDLDVNPFVAVPLAGVVAAGFALPTAALVFRFRGGYLAVGTWAVAEVFRLLVANTPALGRGTGRTLAAVFPMARETRELATYLLAVAIGVAALGGIYAYLRSRAGLALMALRDSEAAASTLGVDGFRTKLVVYLAAAFGTGVTGALLYLNLLRISPDAAFSINWTAYAIFIVVIGGLGTLEGPVLGTLVFFVLREALSGLVPDSARSGRRIGDALAPAGALGPRRGALRPQRLPATPAIGRCLDAPLRFGPPETGPPRGRRPLTPWRWSCLN